jgi:hypothetical protein
MGGLDGLELWNELEFPARVAVGVIYPSWMDQRRSELARQRTEIPELLLDIVGGGRRAQLQVGIVVPLGIGLDHGGARSRLPRLSRFSLGKL